MKVRGWVVRRGKHSIALVLDFGCVEDPATGKKKRKQKWIAFVPEPGARRREALQQAKAALDKLLVEERGGTRVEPTKLTLIAWLRRWLEGERSRWRPSTYDLYRIVVEHHLAKAPIGAMLLQDVRASDVEGYLDGLKAARATVDVHYAVLRGALKLAKRDQLVVANHAADVRLPKRDRQARQKHAKAHCWTAEEARKVLKAAAEAGPQASAYFALALDTGARKGELLGLPWSNLDLEAGLMVIKQTITSRRGEPTFGPTKTGEERTVDLDPDTVAKLRAHKASQSAIKMKNRRTYQDRGLVFAMEPEHVLTNKAQLGDAMTCLLDGKLFRAVVQKAGASSIKPHGMRHTVVTLLLNSGTPVHEVAARVGHSKVSMTLDVYAHALPKQRVPGARSMMGAVLHG